jgi:opacity protein-like surface antigen
MTEAKVRKCVGVILLSLLAPWSLASAQVGHDPARSPFRDIPLRAGPVVFVGNLSADRGRAGAGMSNALTFGARYEIPTGRSLLVQITAAYMKGDRFIIRPQADSTSPDRRTGPVNSNVLFTEVAVQLRLTGAKSWRRIAPYVGAGLGLATELSAPSDSSGYQFGTKITLGAATGLRWFPTSRVMMDASIRGLMWRLRYPISFHTPAPDGSRVVSLVDPLTDWTLHPWISLGVGWTF